MTILARIFIIVLVSCFVSPHLHADAVATLTGIVKNSKGQPIGGAEIRIVGRDADKLGKTHTDSNGRYSYPGLETGTYSVTLLVDGTVKAAIGNVRTKSGEVQTLNFDFQGGASARPFTKGKHYVWVPSQTGSHLGIWVEVDEDAKAASSGMSERLNNQGNALVRQMQANSDGGAIKASAGPMGH